MYTFSDITVTGKVIVKGTASVGGMFGYYCYSNLANLTMEVDPGSYVEAEVYVGGIVGHRTEGTLTATNLKSNIDVYASNGQVGGIAGVALYNNQYINCSSSGDVYVVTDSETKNSKYIGGIIGSWSSAQATVTLTGCSYTGTLHYVLAGEEQTLDDPQQLAGPTYNSGTGELIIN
ncbi:MAG: hypothetical protein LUD17_08710 [Bacteroidales bacterium]|nr:hypothetical protein [Bacteroidales bacterium]